MANEEKLLNLVNVVGEAKDRDEWDQSYWRRETNCGTTMCVAGWQCAIDKVKFISLMPNSNIFSRVWIDKQVIPVWLYAQQVLELTDVQAEELFWNNEDNDYDLFVETIKKIINGEIV